MKKLLLLFVTIQLSVVANAYDFTENGIYFNLKSDGSLEVTGLASWTTRADILSDVTINGRTYRVTSIGAHAFEGRSDITYLSIPWSVTSIGEYAFVDCGSNLTVNIADPESWCQMQLGNEHSSPLSSAGKVLVHDIETTNIVIPEGVTSIGNFTFYQCRCMKSLTLPSSVTSIGSSAFEDCTGLTSLAMSEGLQSIGGSAFQGCTGLKTLTIPSTVKTISINAFANCSNITDVYCYAVNVPETHFDAFDATPTEKSTLHVPANSVGEYKTSWPWSDFKNVFTLGSTPSTPDDNSKKRTIHVAVAGTLPDLISKDEKYQIEELSLTGELNGTDFYYIRQMAGTDYRERSGPPELINTPGQLRSLDLANAKIVEGGIDYLQDYWGARAGTRTGGGTHHTVKNSISSDLFEDTKLQSIIIPSSVTSISPSAFENCNMLKTLVVPDGNQIYDSRDNCNAIIESATNQLIAGCNNTLIPKNVTSIGPSAFQLRTNLSSITIPNSVISIGNNAFSMCYGLSSITIPNSVTSIGSAVFNRCQSLTSITIPNSVTSIGGSSFSDCSGLTSITIPNSVTCIGSYAFYHCSSLTTIVSEIEKPFAMETNVFNSYDKDIYATATLIVPKGTKAAYQSTEGWKQFTNIKEVGEFEVDGICYTIGENNTVSVREKSTKYSGDVVIPSQVNYNGTIYTVTTIGGFAFGNFCTELTSITIPPTVTTFESSAFFDYLFKLSAVYITDLGAWCKIIFKDEDANPLRWAHHLYLNGEEIKDLVIPKGITSINRWAFNGCSGLTSVTISNSVASIGSFAFRGCSGLTTIVSEIENPFEIDGRVFYSNERDIYATATLIVPKGTKAAYQATEGWNKFTNIFEVGDVNGDNKSNNDDLNAIVSYIMGKTPANFNAKVADLNNDGKVNVADVTILVKIIKNIQ